MRFTSLILKERNEEADALEPYVRKPKDKEFLELWREGLTYQQIANKYGFSRQAIHDRHQVLKRRRDKASGS